jgi:hypothetical protein
MYGDMSRQVAATISNNSSSALPAAPLMTYYVSGLEYDQSRMQDPMFVDKMNIRQRTLNQTTGQYETTQGNAFTIERMMPAPYTLRVTLDIWTTNIQQKLEIFEQFMILFNPGFEIQSTDNFVDWTSLSVVYQDGITWSSRSIPQGSGNAIDIMTVKFYMPIWISTPIKVKKMNFIHKIVASIHRGRAVEDVQDDDLLLGTRLKVTPYGYKLLLVGNKLQVLPNEASFTPPNDSLELPVSGPDTDVYWHAFLNVYGVVESGVSMIAIENPYLANEIIGTIEYDPLDDRVLTFNIDTDTLPANTLDPVDSIIDPDLKRPGSGLPVVTLGQRYLIINDIPPQLGYGTLSTIAPDWPGLTSGANPYDIIEFDGTDWVISFSGINNGSVEYVTNLTSGIQYRFSDQHWQKSYEGFYDAGSFRIIL